MIRTKILTFSLSIFAIMLVAGSIIYFSISTGEAKSPITVAKSTTAVKKDSLITKAALTKTKTNDFGLSVNGLEDISKKVSRNQSLAKILRGYGISARTVYQIVQNSHGIFDVRSIRPGHAYHIYQETAVPNAPEYLVYESNPVDYVVFSLSKPYSVHVGHRKVTEVTKDASGVIESSLYLTLDDNNIDPALAEAMADVFAWQIDFYHLRKGDRFRVIYTKKLIDGEPIGIGHIKAAFFEQDGHPYYAFRFHQNGKVDYFDLNGNSLRKAFLKVPLHYTYISSRFSYHRYHPILHRYMPHLGVDFAAPRGTPIHAVGDGVIEYTRHNRYDGNYIKIRHNSVYQTEYLHMSHFARGIHAGVHVKQGTVIGYVGSTGLATGPHLDYRIWKNGREVNPLKIDLPSSNPVKAQNKDAYFQQIGLFISELKAIPYREDSKQRFASAPEQQDSPIQTDQRNTAL